MADEEGRYAKQRRVVFQQAKHNVIYLVLIFSLLAYAVFVTILLYRESHQLETVPKSKPPYLASDLADLYDYIAETKGVCYNPSIVPGTAIREGENTTLSGHEGTYICLDGMPITPDACRIYSFGFNRDDIKFETQMGKRGCRIHMVSANTEYSYTPMGNNVYLYPLNLSNVTGLGKYTLDNFMNLMNHMNKPIQYVKTTERGTEWILLQNIFTSIYNAQFQIKQLRLLLHFPFADDNNVENLLEKYRMLVGLEYYGFSLLYSRPIPGTTYYHASLEMEVATKYETVWVRS